MAGPGPGGSKKVLNISVPTQIKTGSGYVYRVFFIVEPTANGAIYDLAQGGTPSLANTMAILNYIPGQQVSDTAVIYAPFVDGLYINPGTGGVVAVTYD
ncbi:hypothetical protein [Petrachloros mirabilis]